MPKKKEPELPPEEQFKRFQEAAKEHEIEERLPDVERAFERLSRRGKANPRSSKGSAREREPL